MIRIKKASFTLCLAVILSATGCSGKSINTDGVREPVAGRRAGEAGFRNAPAPLSNADRDLLADYGLEVSWIHDMRNNEGGKRIRRFDIANGRLMIETTDAGLHHLDVASGRLIGTTRFYDLMTAPPAMNGDTIYVHTFRGMAYVGMHTGTVLRRLPARIPLSVRPVPYEGDLILGSASGTVIRFDTDDGAHRWVRSVRAAVHEPIVVQQHRAYFASRRNFFVVRADSGAMLGSWQPPGELSITSAPAVNNGLAYVGLSNRFLYCLGGTGRREGELGVRWRFAAGSTIAQAPVVRGDDLLVATLEGDMIYMTTSPSPRQIWSHPDASRYLMEGDAGLYFLTRDSSFVLLDPETGEEQWRIPVGEQVFAAADSQNAAILLASPDGVVFCLVER